MSLGWRRVKQTPVNHRLFRMAELSAEQEAYLERHGVALSEVLDASGMRTKKYKALMTLLDKRIAIGVTPCGSGGHTMRDSAGRCVECNPASFAFHNRYRQNAYVYVAGSKQKQIIKVGFSESPQDRGSHLITLGYVAPSVCS